MKGLFADRPAADSVADGTLYFATDSPLLSYSDGSVWTAFELGVPVSVPPAVWNWENQGSSTITVVNGSLKFSHVGSGAVVAFNDLPAGIPYTYTVKLLPENAPDTNNRFRGICVRDGVNRLELVIGRNLGQPCMLFAGRNLEAYEGTPIQGIPFDITPIWLQIANDGTTRSFKFSFDGVNWCPLYSESGDTLMTETQYGLMGYSDNPSVRCNLGVSSMQVG